MSNIIAFVLLLAVSGLSSGAERVSSNDVKNFYAQLDPSTYSKMVRPNFESGEPVDVKVTMYVLSLHDFDQANSKVKIEAYFRQAWNDTRLAHSGASAIHGQHELLQLMWVPDTFVSNSLSGKRYETLVPNVFVRVSPKGEVLFSQRVTQEVWCKDHVSRFPFDAVSCGLEIESYGFSTKDIRYAWPSEQAVGMEHNMTESEFKVLGIEQREQTMTLSTGEYSRLIATVSLERLHCSYIVKYFLPLVLLTSLSLATYCLPKSIARRALTICSSLATILAYVLMNQKLPVTGIPTAFDFFAIGCIIFAIIAVVNESRQLDASTAGSEAQKVGPDGEILGSYARPLSLRDRVLDKAVPIAYVAFLVIYTATCAIVKRVA